MTLEMEDIISTELQNDSVIVQSVPPMIPKYSIEEVAPQPGFIFTADKAINPLNEGKSVRILEKLPVAELKSRFARYNVNVVVGEDCSICATISRGEVSISVDYDENGIVILGISSNDKVSTDILGNRVRSSLRNAIGDTTANCDVGMWMTCASPRLTGLHYIVDENKGCSLVVKEKQPTKIPACASIGGFQIFKAP